MLDGNARGRSALKNMGGGGGARLNEEVGDLQRNHLVNECRPSLRVDDQVYGLDGHNLVGRSQSGEALFRSTGVDEMNVLVVGLKPGYYTRSGL